MVNKNKKGQEFSVVTLVILGLAILTALIIAWGFYTNWTFITGKTKVLPSDLALKAEACKLSSSNQAAYCGFGDPLKISGISGDIYVNCEYNDPNFMAEIKENIANPLECADNTEADQCAKLRSNVGFKGAKVNSLDCTKLTADELKTIEDNKVVINNPASNEETKKGATNANLAIYYRGFTVPS